MAEMIGHSPDDSVPRNAIDSTFATLTSREWEVLQLYLCLLNDKKVAGRLGTKVQTVRNQLASIEHKLHVCSREELISVALTRATNPPA